MSLPRCGTKMADAAFPRIPKTNKRKITIIIAMRSLNFLQGYEKYQIGFKFKFYMHK